MRNDFLINRKIHQYILPGVLMTVAMQLGDVVDGMIVGNLLGSDAMAAIEVCMPVLMIQQMPAMLLAMGGAAEISILLGKRKQQQANEGFTAMLLSGVVLSLLIAAFTFILPGPLANLLSGNQALAELAKPYLMVNFAGIPVLTLAIMFGYLMNIDNYPQYGSALFIIANIVNLTLDIYFIKSLHMGMFGSALSTILGYLTGLVTVIIYMKSRHRMLHFTRLTEGAPAIVKAIALAGIPAAMLTLMSAGKSVILNSVIVRYMGNDIMAIYSVCVNAVLIAELFVGGIIGLIPSIAGVLFGEKDYFGVRVLCKKILQYSYITIAVLMAVFLFLPQGIAMLFGIRSGEMAEMTYMALRIFALSFPFYVFNKFMMSYYQTTLHSGISTFVTVLQGFGLLVPITLIGIMSYGLKGLCIAAVLSEFLTIVCAAGYRKWMFQRGKFSTGNLYLLPKDREMECFDYSIENTIEDMIQAREGLLRFCSQQNIADFDAKILGLSLEEIVNNIIRYGYPERKKYYVDVNLLVEQKYCILRIRDDGIPFDPMTVEVGEMDTVTGGITLLKRMVTDFQYMRVLNMNNTIIELDIGRK